MIQFLPIKNLIVFCNILFPEISFAQISNNDLNAYYLFTRNTIYANAIGRNENAVTTSPTIKDLADQVINYLSKKRNI